MSLNNIKAMKSERGFTIVELLIVIVIIGILAAIVIVAYNGITSRANTSKAQANATSVQKIAETMNADDGNYPATLKAFSDGSNTTKLPEGVFVVSAGTCTSCNLATASTAAGASIASKKYDTVAVYETANNKGGVIFYREGDDTVTAKPVYFGDAKSDSSFNVVVSGS